MQNLSDLKSTEDNRLYKSKAVIFFNALEECRLGLRTDQSVLINIFKQLVNPPTFPFRPIMAYLHAIYRNMLQTDLTTIRYLFSLDNSFLNEVLEHRSNLLKECLIAGSPVFHQFLYEDCGCDTSYELTLCNACFFGNEPLVKYLVLDKNAEVNCEDLHRLTPLMLAVKSGQNKILDFLLNNHADVMIATDLGTVFHYAIRENKVIALCRLLGYARDNHLQIENIKDKQGNTIIHSAIILKSSKDILQILLKFFDFSIKDERGYDLLTYSCLVNNTEAADYFEKNCANLRYDTLVDNGVNVLHLCSISSFNHKTALWLVENNKIGIESQLNNNDTTALQLAVISNNYNLLDAFIKYIFRTKKTFIFNLQDINKRHVGFNLLEKPAMHSFLKKLIQDADLDLLQKDVSNQSFLEYVIAQQEFSILRDCLIKTQRSNKKQRRRVSAFLTNPSVIIQILNFLILELVEKRKSLDIIAEAIDDWVLNGQTILHLICLFWPVTAIQEYIDKYSPDLTVRNSDGQTVISYLLLNEKTDILLSLIDLYNPKLRNLDNHKSSLLHLACELQNIDLVKKGLLHNLSALQIRSDFQSPLDIAIVKDNNLIFMILWNSISEKERLEYCLYADEKTRQYLQENNLYDALINFIFEVIQEDVLTEDLLYLSLKTTIEEQSIFNYCEYLVTDFINETLQLVITESEEFITESEAEVISDDSLLEISQSELTLSKQDFLAAVTRRDYNFFRDIRDLGTFNPILSLIAIELLRESIKTQDQQLTLILLNFSVIEEQSYLHDNCILEFAKTNKQSQVIERLLKVPKVQRNLVRYSQSETLLPGVLPACWSNPKYQIVLLRISNVLQKDKYQNIILLDYGSSLFKFNPKDLDLFIPNSDIDIDLIVSEFISELCSLGARITVTDPYDKPGYLSPRKKPVRRVIPIDFLNCKLEIVLSSQSIVEHAYSLLTTVTAAYFNIRELQMYAIPGINTFEHMQNCILDTVIEPELSFSIDFTRVLRLLLMLATCPRFNLSTRCFNTIFNLFSGDSNLFFSKNYNYTKLHLQLSELYSSEYAYNSIFIMYKLNVLPKLIDFLVIKKDEASRVYARSLFAWKETITSSELNLGSIGTIAKVT